jgi:hypothetical protein
MGNGSICAPRHCFIADVCAQAKADFAALEALRGEANAPLATARSSGRNELEHELGWRAIETFETGLEKTVRWHLDNRPWWQAILDRGYKAKRIGCVRPRTADQGQQGQVIGSVMWSGFLSKRNGFMASR